MACDLKTLNNYGDGSLGAVSNPTGQLNSYANVTAYTANSVTIGTAAAGAYETFAAGKEIMLHVSATNGTSQDVTYLGKYLICKITAVNGSVLTVDKDFTAILPAAQLTNYIVQAITIAQLQNLTLSSGFITPPAFSVTNKYGGILLAKCADTVTFSGGSINLVDKGIPAASTAYRPKTAQELQGTADTDKYSGWENHITLRQFLLNAGDGAAMIIAKHFVQTGTASRIGGTAAGAQFTRGTIGGSTIALIAGDMTGFDPSIISKTKGSGQGLGRCYIASNTKLCNDEGLYAYDVTSNPYRLMRTLNIKNYGDGSLGDVTNPTAPMNNYARVTAISADGKTIMYSNKTATGIAPIAADALVMFHVSKHTDNAEMLYLGNFILAKVLSDDGINLILDTPVTNVFDVTKLTKYNCQIISVAQFTNLTINTQYKATPIWNKTNCVGGICAIACSGNLDLSNGDIDLATNFEPSGETYTGDSYISANPQRFSNSLLCDALPIGRAHGSAFILAKNMKADISSRIGALYTGNDYGGYGHSSGTRGGYSAPAESYVIPYKGAENTAGNSFPGSTNQRGDGAHIFMVIDTLAAFYLDMVSTGGNGLAGRNPGGAGYGGAGEAGGYFFGGGYGSFNGGNGWFFGSPSGWTFIYANVITTENTAGTVV